MCEQSLMQLLVCCRKKINWNETLTPIQGTFSAQTFFMSLNKLSLDKFEEHDLSSVISHAEID